MVTIILWVSANEKWVQKSFGMKDLLPSIMCVGCMVLGGHLQDWGNQTVFQK